MNLVVRRATFLLAVLVAIAGPTLGNTVTALPAAWAAPAAPAAPTAQATVSQDAVATKPCDLGLAPDGEFRVLHFNAGLVSSVLVAKPWLVAVMIEGNDVVLQAKGTSGTTQLVAYVGDTGTLWQVTIASHVAAPMRIVVLAPGETQAAAVTPPAPATPGHAGHPVARPQDPRLTAFLTTLTPAQRAGFDAWRRDPQATVLAEWLARLSAEQQAAFDALVQTQAIMISTPLGPQAGHPAPPLVDTTTVIGQPGALTAAGALPATNAPQPPVAQPAPAAPPMPQAQPALYADAQNVPSGMTVTVTAAQTGDAVEVRYAIHNGLGVTLANPHVVAMDGQGHAVTLAGAPSRAIAPGKDASGVVVAHTTLFPMVVRWAWDTQGTETVVIIPHTISHGTAQFDVVVTP